MKQSAGGCIECGGQRILQVPQVASQFGDDGGRYAAWELVLMSGGFAVGQVEAWVCAECGRVELFVPPRALRDAGLTATTRQEAWAERDARLKSVPEPVPPTWVAIRTVPRDEEGLAAFQVLVSAGLSLPEARAALIHIPSRVACDSRGEAEDLVRALAEHGVVAEIAGTSGGGPYR